MAYIHQMPARDDDSLIFDMAAVARRNQNEEINLLAFRGEHHARLAEMI